MSLFPVIVVFGLSFPPIFSSFFITGDLLAGAQVLVPTGIYDFVWHPALFNTALYCCLFYLISRMFV
ncbi:DUF1656 domain-containing protein [Enterobacter hormaechei]|uniref:DUF1656 domain-containing protein n=1 Tax=Enterobacter hormaechei TaxID=158836 RepID=A0A4Y5ZPC0_9ENTR|nr:DUF1656 domain-containing protein [Enterobacter hormaechei]